MVAGATAFYKTAYAFVFSKDLFRTAWDSIEQGIAQTTGVRGSVRAIGRLWRGGGPAYPGLVKARITIFKQGE